MTLLSSFFTYKMNKTINIQNELDNNSILLSIMSSQSYNNSITSLVKGLENKKICYVTLTKTSSSLIKIFKSRNIDTNNLFFIDAITSSMNHNKEINNGILISSPSAFTELSIAINEVLKSGSFDLLIFDSLSMLKVYRNENIAIRFASDIIQKVRSRESKGIFTCTDYDSKTNFIQNSSTYVDKILDYNITKNVMISNKAKNAILPLAFMLLFSMALMFSGTSNSLTAYAVAESSNQAISPLFSFVILIITLSLLFIYVKLNHSHVHVLKKANSPTKISKDKLRSSFRKKIHGWLDNLSCIFIGL